jgi:hypothetical protein
MPTTDDAIAVWQHHTGESSYPEDLVEDRGEYWYLPNPTPVLGSAGTIVSKADSRVTALGSGCPPPDAFWAYERGLLNHRCDLIITSVSDIENTIDCLTKTPPSQRVSPRPMKRDGWHDRLSNLPTVVFEGTSLHHYIPELKEIFNNGYAELKVVPAKYAP